MPFWGAQVTQLPRSWQGGWPLGATRKMHSPLSLGPRCRGCGREPLTCAAADPVTDRCGGSGHCPIRAKASTLRPRSYSEAARHAQRAAGDPPLRRNNCFPGPRSANSLQCVIRFPPQRGHPILPQPSTQMSCFKSRLRRHVTL